MTMKREIHPFILEQHRFTVAFKSTESAGF
jgi:hypothetical protein